MKRREGLTAVLFLATLLAAVLALSAGALDRLCAPPAASATAVPEGWADSAESAVNAMLDQNHLFIQLYGGVQRLLGRRFMEDADPQYNVYRLSDGTLSFVNPEPFDPAPRAEALTGLEAALAERDVPLLYVQAPQKIAPSDDRLPLGVTDYSNRYADEFLALLEAAGTDTLDLREALADSGAPWSSLFFRTDHHWNPEGAFVGWQALAEHLRDSYGLSIPAPYTDPDAYTKTVYEDWFLGSQGKRVGALYAGVDDITLWTPAFETSFTYTAPAGRVAREGPLERALLFPERVAEKDWFEGNPYTLYAGGDYPTGIMVNRLSPDGPSVVLLRDSYACALTPFLALGCGTLTTYDLRYWTEDDHLMTLLGWARPDLVIVMYGAGSLRVDSLFRFETP
ncbi:MAG: hypothetical protein GX585_01785 [Clostridiales bacterium]|nr:hypothetical protein [Clostridiales bacterium]